MSTIIPSAARITMSKYNILNVRAMCQLWSRPLQGLRYPRTGFQLQEICVNPDPVRCWYYDVQVLGFNDTSTLVAEKGSKEIDERVEEMKWDREERVTGMKVKNQRNKNILPLPLPATRMTDLAQIKANFSWTPRWREIPNTFATPNHPTMFKCSVQNARAI